MASLSEGILAVVMPLLDKLTDPTINSALGPQSGLQVAPVTFQSIETEGRWKPASLVNNDDNSLIKSGARVFELAGDGHFEEQDPLLAPLGPTLREPYGKIMEKNVKLFTVTVPGAGLSSPLSSILSLINSRQSDPSTNCSFTVDATWWYDNLEIYGGLAGLANATGFGSAFNTTANVALQAIPFGNYYPASILITWSGWVNPIGPEYWEFRGGIVLDATGRNARADRNDGQPAFMKYWGRGQNQNPLPVEWSDQDGFLLKKVTEPTPSGADSALKALMNILSGAGPISPFPGGP